MYPSRGVGDGGSLWTSEDFPAISTAPRKSAFFLSPGRTQSRYRAVRSFPLQMGTLLCPQECIAVLSECRPPVLPLLSTLGAVAPATSLISHLAKFSLYWPDPCWVSTLPRGPPWQVPSCSGRKARAVSQLPIFAQAGPLHRCPFSWSARQTAKLLLTQASHLS